MRSAVPEDDDALSRICLLTGAAGSSAEADHAIPELLGLIFAVPYNHLETTFGFVLVDTSGANSGKGSVVGYILGATDSKKFEAVAERDWWPSLREKYPKGEYASRTAADASLIDVIHSPYINPEDITSRYPAHIHIDILPSHQRKSHGRKLMALAVTFLKERGHTGLFVGLHPKNEEAKKFYAKIGFKRIDREGGEWWSLDFDQFNE